MPGRARMPRALRQRLGMSLVELLMVAAIIAVVVGMVLMTMGKVLTLINSWK